VKEDTLVLTEKMLAKLVCPKCKGRLKYRQDAERLDCKACNVAFRVEKGIPVLLIDEAEKL
jgi:uncharacterized protein YbaR (Trm112 family)